MRVHVSSLGCKLNQSEMEELAAQLAQAGHQVVGAAHEADLCILNTCAVTHVAAQKSRQALRRLHRDQPGARLVVTGCYAQLNPAELQGLPGVAQVVGNQDKERLARLLDTGLDQPEPPAVRPELRSRTRALVKIQDGCDNACTYCIIHIARGAQRCRPPEQVLAEVKARLAAGHQEVVLTGVHIGAYGRDHGWAGSPHPDLWGLVARILAETAVPRLRLSSIEPWDLPEHALRLWQDPRLCRHLHLPLQSGSDTTLRRMARRYTVADFVALLETARAAIPDLAVTTDVIVGFPGESDVAFAESLAAVQRMAFARVHVFPYSRRPGTPAASMADQVPPPVKSERARAMRAVAAAGEQDFRRGLVGRSMDVLWEGAEPRDGGRVWSGLTDNYVRVYAASATELANRRTATWLEALVADGLWGRIEDQKSGGRIGIPPPPAS